jgi:alanine dehydrogenase
MNSLNGFIIGVPQELKENEMRVSLIPDEVEKIVSNLRLKVIVQSGAGMGAYHTDEDYKKAGATICDKIEEVYKEANLIIKVKEPQEYEYSLINEGHIIMAFFHFGGNPKLKEAMIKAKACCIPYEIIKDEYNLYPILSPMSKIAGESSITEAIKFLITNGSIENNKLTSVPITIIGVGNAGKAAVEKAIQLGYTNINLIDKDYEKINKMQLMLNCKAYEMNDANLLLLLKKSMIVIGSIYNHNQTATRLITDELLSLMPTNSIFMDIAIDQGGMTSRSVATTINSPIIKYNQTNIYCVPNIPSTQPHKASKKLSKNIYPLIISVTSNNIEKTKEKYLIY